MLTISVRTDLDRLARDLGPRLQRQVRFAAAMALTKTAQHIKEAQYREMKDVFQQPTPYTLKSLYLRAATKANLRARVWLKGDYPGEPAHYLYPNIRGGSRGLKRFEQLLRAAGILPNGMFAVPGSAARMDAYGNMQRGQIVQILSYFRSFNVAGFSANMDEKGRARLARGTRRRHGFAYFVGRPGDGKLPLGVWQRFQFASGSAIKPVLIFVDGATYRRIYDFRYTARLAFDRHWNAELERAVALAKATAR